MQEQQSILLVFIISVCFVTEKICSSDRIVNDQFVQQKVANQQKFLSAERAFEQTILSDEEQSRWRSAMKSVSLIDDFPTLDPETDFQFYNEKPLDLDLITFLSTAWRRSHVNEWEIETEDGHKVEQSNG
ncbi:uncharacterized protein LOC142353524 isoform X2 [Convolutriloba macropyga]